MASENVVELTAANWESEVVQSDKPVMVDIWAPWCGPCRMLTPVVEKVADQFAGKVKVGKLNMDDNQEIAIRYGVSAIPVLLFFPGGSGDAEQKMVGLQQEGVIVKELNRMLGS